MKRPKRPGANTKKKRDVRTKHNNATYKEMSSKQRKQSSNS